MYEALYTYACLSAIELARERERFERGWKREMERQALTHMLGHSMHDDSPTSKGITACLDTHFYIAVASVGAKFACSDPEIGTGDWAVC